MPAPSRREGRRTGLPPPSPISALPSLPVCLRLSFLALGLAALAFVPAHRVHPFILRSKLTDIPSLLATSHLRLISFFSSLSSFSVSFFFFLLQSTCFRSHPEHHLQAAISAAAIRAAASSRPSPSSPNHRSSTSSSKPPPPISETLYHIPTPDATGLVSNYASLYIPGRWHDPSTYVRFSDTVEETSAGSAGLGFLYTLDERDDEWLKNNNRLARGEGPSTPSGIAPTSESGRTRGKGKGRESEEIVVPVISEDEFELVMALMEKWTDEKVPTLHTVRSFSVGFVCDWWGFELVSCHS